MQASLSPYAILGIIAAYFVVLIAISYFTSRGGNDNDSFFLAGRKSPWPLVAVGMIGATLSGVTFISVPGAVGAGGANQVVGMPTKLVPFTSYFPELLVRPSGCSWWR